MGGRSAETMFGQNGVEFYLKDSDNDVKVQIYEGEGVCRQAEQKRRGHNSSKRMIIMVDMMRKAKAKEEIGAKTVGGSVNCWLQIVGSVASPTNGRTQCSNGTLGCRTAKEKNRKEERKTPEACQSNDFQGGRMRMFLAQNH